MPTEYICTDRLEHVRAKLSNLDSEVNTDAEVARRLDFTHLSRFGSTYAEKYGEDPQ